MQLPEPQVLWSGAARIVGTGEVPARLVRRYVNRAQPKEQFKPTPEYIVETAPTQDALGAPVWKPASLADLPASFFASVYPEPTLVPQEEPRRDG